MANYYSVPVHYPKHSLLTLQSYNSHIVVFVVVTECNLVGRYQQTLSFGLHLEGCVITGMCTLD